MKPERFRLLPEALVSVPVFGLSFLWVALVQIGEWAALGDSPGNLALRLVLSLIAHVVMFAFPFITLRVLSPQVSARSRTWLLLLSVVLGAAVRGIVLGILFTATGVTTSPEFVFRVIASISHLAVIVVILWFLVSEVRGLHARRYQLITERDQLQVLQQDAQRDLEQLSDRATGEIRRSILESLGGLRSTDSTELRQRLRTTIDDVVRPLSHKLAAQPTAWAPPQTPPQTMGVDWPLAVREGLNPVRIHPIIVPVLLVWLGLPIHLFQYGPTLTAGLVATLIVAIPAFWLARRVAIRLTSGLGSGAKAVAFVVAVVIGGIALGLATLPYMQGQPQPFLFVVVAPLLALLISGPLAIAEAARDQDRELEADLAATTADLRWMLARTRERYRQQEGALAHALHGRLQASLAAAFLRLDRATAQGIDDEGLLEALQAEVLDAISELDVTDFQPDPIDKLIALTQSNWSGAVHVTFAFDEQAKAALAKDPLCARSVNDLIPELVFNSVRHGSASVIEVRLEVAGPKTLSLSVIDDGSNELNSTYDGLGSTLLNEASIIWARTREEGRTATTCLLPCLSPNAALVSR
jgi:ABC-type multidrug transport system fused ATPase/permease subunit